MTDLDSAIKIVEASSQFKLVKRLVIDEHPGFHTGAVCEAPRIGVCVDTETTGFAYGKDKVIELGMISFEFDPVTYNVIRIIDRYSGFEDPGEPLCQDVINVTGITDEMLAGQKFDDERVNAMLARADVVIAHNSNFDRPFCEDRFPVSIQKCWACTLAQVDWNAEYISAKALEYLLFKCGGWFIDAHRALNDAEGLLALLMENLPHSGNQVMRVLIEKARSKDFRFYAISAPFDNKGLLKERGYRWNDGEDGKPKAWWKDIEISLAEAEITWLEQDVYYGGDASSVVKVPINAFSRFSRR